MKSRVERSVARASSCVEETDRIDSELIDRSMTRSAPMEISRRV